MDLPVYYSTPTNGTPTNGTPTEYYDTVHNAMQTTHQERTPLSSAFFSPQNIQNVQNLLQQEILRRSGGNYRIGNQNDIHIMTVMRAIYVINSRNLSFNVPRQVQELNILVINEMVPNVLSNIQQYLGYIRDASQMYTPMPPPVDASIKNTRTSFVYNPGFQVDRGTVFSLPKSFIQ